MNFPIYMAPTVEEGKTTLFAKSDVWDNLLVHLTQIDAADVAKELHQHLHRSERSDIQRITLESEEATALLDLSRVPAPVTLNPHVVSSIVPDFVPSTGFIAYKGTSYEQGTAPVWRVNPFDQGEIAKNAHIQVSLKRYAKPSLVKDAFVQDPGDTWQGVGFDLLADELAELRPGKYEVMFTGTDNFTFGPVPLYIR